MTQLSPHFSLAELTVSQTAARKNIDNTPDAEELAALTFTASQMERVRKILGKPIIVSSGFRSKALNAVVPGSSNTSHHTLGYAVDFTCPAAGTPLQVAQKLANALPYDQLIHEFGAWVHISFHPRMRSQELTIDRMGVRGGLSPAR